MAGPGKWSDASNPRAPYARRALSAAAAGLVLAAVAGCGSQAAEQGPESRERTALQRVLDGQATAVREGKERGYLDAVDPGAKDYRTAQRQVFANLGKLPLTHWSYTVGDVRSAAAPATTERPAGDVPAPGQRVEADVRLRYKLRDDDRAPVSATERLVFVERSGKWYVSGELPDSERQLWEQGEIAVERGERSLLLGVDRTPEELRALASSADQAVTEVGEAWPRKWPRRVVVEAPSSLGDMAALLGAKPETYQGIAAVTTGEAGERTDAPADRIVVNPEAYGELSEQGRQVVLTHETVHVASRTHTGRATPLWLSEGLADWIAYGAADRTPQDSAVELGRAADKDKLPRELPTDRDFRFGSDAESLGRAYESGWLACRLIEEKWGEDKLLAVYLRAGASQKRQSAAVEDALRTELGVGKDEFTERWRSYVREQVA